MQYSFNPFVKKGTDTKLFMLQTMCSLHCRDCSSCGLSPLSRTGDVAHRLTHVPLKHMSLIDGEIETQIELEQNVICYFPSSVHHDRLWESNFILTELEVESILAHPDFYPRTSLGSDFVYEPFMPICVILMCHKWYSIVSSSYEINHVLSRSR